MALAHFVVHLISQMNNFADAIRCEMHTVTHHFANPSEYSKCFVLVWRAQRVFAKEWDHLFFEIMKTVDLKVVNPIPSPPNCTTFQSSLQELKNVSFTLRDIEASPNAPSKFSVVDLLDADVETPFAIHKSSEVVSGFIQRFSFAHLTEPFLLIACTGRFVTAACAAVAPDTQGFQHMAKFIFVTTTVEFIVTAAVHRGFSSKLRLALRRT